MPRTSRRVSNRGSNRRVRLVSRNGKDWTKEFPQVAYAVGRLPAVTALLDGEVAAVLPSGATSFQALQKRASFYPDLGFTKLDLALYYVTIADAVLPHLDGRPLTLVRCPDGIGGETFYQKHPGFWTPPQVRRFVVPGKAEEYLYVDSVPGLVALAQVAILEIHPWNSRAGRLEEPDQVIFDLDPDEALPFSRVAAAARHVRALLTERGLESFVKTTGGKGLHVCVPLELRHGWEELTEFTRAVAQRLARDEPETFTASMLKSHRKGKVYVDYLRNVRGANAVGPFSTRAREGAPVSFPVGWDELDRLSGPRDFTVAEVPLRVLGWTSGRAVDPWAQYRKVKQRVPASLTRDLAG